MPTISINETVTTTIDGVTINGGGSFVADVQDFVDQTRDFSTTYEEVFTGTMSFVVIVNVGSEDLLVRCGVGADYALFSCPIGAHCVIPGVLDANSGTIGNVGNVFARSVTGTGRAICMVGIKNT